MWRIKTSEELDKLIKHKNTVNHIKAQRLSWFGHVLRMPDTGTVKKIFKWNPLTKKSQGRPKYIWEDSVKQDICQTRVKNWITCFQDRGKWKNVFVCDDIRNLNLIKKVTGWFPSGSGHAFVPCEAYISLTRKSHTNQLN